MITDAGLKLVIERNPSLRKLSVPGYVRLTIDGILSNLEVFKAAGKPRLNYLGIYGVSGLTYSSLKSSSSLGMHNSKLPVTHKPRFFGDGKLCNNVDDDCAMDVEVCRGCHNDLSFFNLLTGFISCTGAAGILTHHSLNRRRSRYYMEYKLLGQTNC